MAPRFRYLVQRLPPAFVWLTLLSSGCSVSKFAVNRVGDALASGGSVYESDDDLVLVGDALPFSLKFVESLLAESTDHQGLLLTACRGFTTYSYVYVHHEVDVSAVRDRARARELRERARRLYLRAHAYGLRGLERSYPGIADDLFSNPVEAASRVTRSKDVPMLYWSAASLGLAISVSRHDATLLARLPEVDALLGRAFALDESWKRGTLHEFEVVFASARPGAPKFDEMESHFNRALELSRGTRAGLYVSYAEAVAVPRQDRAQFDSLLDQALTLDPDAYEEVRLANLVAQRRARWLRSRADELILPADADGSGGGTR